MIKNTLSKTSFCLIIVSILYTGILTILALKNIKQPTTFTTKAVVGSTAQIYFTPNNLSLNSEQLFSLNINSGAYPVTFARIVLNFNPSQIKLNRDFIANNKFGRTIKTDSFTQANSVGKLNITLAIDPSQGWVTSPSGSFELGQLYFTPVTSQNNLVSVINFDTGNCQLVGTDAAIITPNYSTLSLLINPTPTVTPTAIPTLIPTTSPTPTLASSSCKSVCQKNSYSTGTCRSNISQCNRRQEIHLSSGDTNCRRSLCCCK